VLYNFNFEANTNNVHRSTWQHANIGFKFCINDERRNVQMHLMNDHIK